MRETCKNPWKTRCNNTDIILSIMIKGLVHPICRNCWLEISVGNLEWSNQEKKHVATREAENRGVGGGGNGRSPTSRQRCISAEKRVK